MEDNLEYPLNINYILRKKKLLKRKLLNKGDFIPKNIAILGGSSTSEIINILEIFLLKNGIKPSFYESEYNKFYEEAVFNIDNLAKFNPDIVYIHTTNKNILIYPNLKDTENDVKILLENELEKYKLVWNSLLKLNCSIIQNNFDNIVDRSLGNLDFSDIHGQTFFINQLNNAFSENARVIENLYINDINYLSSYLGLKNWFDRVLWYQAKYALSMSAIPELVFNITKIINSIFGQTKKCLVLDLDNTCWGGVIGDDGLDKIVIGKNSALAEAFTSFQIYVNELKKRGIAIAVSSKNDIDNAKEGFRHPETVLEFSDFVAFKANWDEKYLNILDIASELNIGVDSIVFIDDNPMERDIVSSQIHKITVPNIGEKIEKFIDYIDKNGYFEPTNLIDEDIHRNKYYQDNNQRVLEKANFHSYDDFLLSLNMSASIKTFSTLHVDRIIQLTNKTNQFNLTSKKYTFGEIKSLCLNKDYIKIYGKLFDKYGDNGVVSLIIGRIQTSVCHIDLWLMSCRVFKRGMEFAMLDEFVNQCRGQKVVEIRGYYFKTSKNKMVSKLYEKCGFKLIELSDGKSSWVLKIKNYKNINKTIRLDYE